MTELSEFYRERGAIRYGTQNLDGTPHMAYYNTDRRLSFTWNGDADSPIEISYDGYGEPVYAEITQADSPVLFNLMGLKMFQVVCETWMSTHPKESWEE